MFYQNFFLFLWSRKKCWTEKNKEMYIFIVIKKIWKKNLKKEKYWNQNQNDEQILEIKENS